MSDPLTMHTRISDDAAQILVTLERGPTEEEPEGSSHRFAIDVRKVIASSLPTALCVCELELEVSSRWPLLRLSTGDMANLIRRCAVADRAARS